MPLAMAKFGITLGVFVIVFSGLMSGFGLYLQTRCARYIERGTASFFSLSQLTYPNAAVVFDAAIAIKCFGVYAFLADLEFVLIRDHEQGWPYRISSLSETLCRKS